MHVKVFSTSTNPLPKYETSNAAGMDVLASNIDTITIYPGELKMIPTGLTVEIPEGFEIQVRSRSGLTYKNQVVVANSPGTIDADYRGQIGVLLINHGKEVFTVSHGDRVAQLVLAPVAKCEWINSVQGSLSTTTRGEGGFGSTGVKS